jgi:hypothetical protein
LGVKLKSSISRFPLSPRLRRSKHKLNLTADNVPGYAAGNFSAQNCQTGHFPTVKKEFSFPRALALSLSLYFKSKKG